MLNDYRLPEPPPGWQSYSCQDVAGSNYDALVGLKPYFDNNDKPFPLRIKPANIPDEMKALPQWVNWKYEWDEKKWTKPPYHPKGFKASKTNPAHFSSFETVLAAYEKGDFDGIGFVLTAGDPFVAIDIDKCLCGDILTEEAKGIIEELNSYTEVSPSGAGIRIFVKGSIPRNIKTGIELYGQDSYVTITGQRWLI